MSSYQDRKCAFSMSHLCLKVLKGIKPDRKGSAPAHQCLQGVKVGVVLRLLQCFSLQPPLPSLPTRLLQPIKTRQGGGECFSLCDESLDLCEAEFWVCCQASRRPLLPAVEAESEPCHGGRVCECECDRRRRCHTIPARRERPRSTLGWGCRARPALSRLRTASTLTCGSDEGNSVWFENVRCNNMQVVGAPN